MRSPLSALRSRVLARRSDDGASAVEFALLFPVFCVLVFGTISAGIAFTHKIALTQAAREGSRYGATLPIGSDMTAWLQSVKNAAVGAAQGDFSDGSPFVCVAYVAATGTSPATQSLSQSLPSGGLMYTSQPCFTNDGQTDSHVQVQLRRSTDWNLLVTSTTVHLESTSVSRYER